MPEKPLAIQLRFETIPRISRALDIPEKELLGELAAYTQSGDTAYFVKGAYYGTKRLPYLIYTEREFLTDFAQAPPSIRDQFVPVLPIQIGP
jgi:hypothetical protein